MAEVDPNQNPGEQDDPMEGPDELLARSVCPVFSPF